IQDALSKPIAAIAYELSRRLKLLFPGRYCLETTCSYFDVEEFAREGQCKLTYGNLGHPQIQTTFYDVHHDLYYSIDQAWVEILWEEKSFRVVMMEWPSGQYGKEQFRWILADSKECAEQFFRAVCVWCSEVRS